MKASKNAADFYNAAEGTMINLWERWMNEKNHENINDYLIPINGIAAKHGVKIEKMTKRPFGCQFSVEDGRIYQLKVSAGNYSYRRIA